MEFLSLLSFNLSPSDLLFQVGHVISRHADSHTGTQAESTKPLTRRAASWLVSALHVLRPPSSSLMPCRQTHRHTQAERTKQGTQNTKRPLSSLVQHVFVRLIPPSLISFPLPLLLPPPPLPAKNVLFSLLLPLSLSLVSLLSISIS